LGGVVDDDAIGLKAPIGGPADIEGTRQAAGGSEKAAGPARRVRRSIA